MNFNGKIAIVTGASEGIGKAIALEFAIRGAKVVLASRNINKLEQVKARIENNGGTAISVQTDVSIEKDCENLINKTVSTFGKIDILVNNAGISMRANFNELKTDVIRKVMDINFFGTVYCTKYALPYILKEKGYIVGISSISGITPLPGRTGYCASKFAMSGFLKTLQLEHKKDGLNVLIVYPGFTNSEIRKNALTKDGTPQEKSPRTEEKMMSSEKLAEIIANGIEKNKTQIITTLQGKITVFFYRLFPRLVDRLILKTMKKEPDSPNF